MFNAADSVINSEKWNSYFRDFDFPWKFYNVSEYQNLLELTNFKIIDCKMINVEMKHEGINGLKGWIEATWLPYLSKINNTQINSFVDDVVNNFIANNQSQQTEHIYTNMKRLLIHAQRQTI